MPAKKAPAAPRTSSPNVTLAFLFWFFNGTAQGLATGPAMTAYVYVVTGRSPILVGISQAVRGGCNLLCGVPAGFAADAASRSRVLRVAAVVLTMAAGATTYAVLVEEHRWEMLCVALALWGASFGSFFSALESLFADSVPTGQRARIYAVKWQCNVASRAVGPSTAAVLFYFFGDHWREYEIRDVILCGLGAYVVPITLLWLFRDEWALGSLADAHGRVRSPRQKKKKKKKKRLISGGSASSLGSDNDREEAATPLLSPAGRAGLSSSPAAAAAAVSAVAINGDGDVDEAAAAVAGLSRAPPSAHQRKWVPRLIAVLSVLTGLAAGMTVKFFAVFLIDKVGLNPVAVNCIFASNAMLTAVFAELAKRTSAQLGRLPVYLAHKLCGVALLAAMAVMPHYWQSPEVIVPVYVCRTAFANSVSFLMTSTLMDYVPREHRGKWSTINLVTGVGWSGSALAGGYLIHHFGWSATFMSTAALQALALVPCVVLMTMIPWHEVPKAVASIAHKS